MAEDAPPAAPAMTPEEVQAETELRMRDIGQRFGAIPEDHDELLRLLEVSAALANPLLSPYLSCSVSVVFVSQARRDVTCNSLSFCVAFVLCSRCVCQSGVSRCSFCNCLSFWRFFLITKPALAGGSSSLGLEKMVLC